MLVGTEEGHIYLGVVQVDAMSGRPEVLEPFKLVMQTPEYSPLIDIKVCQIKDVFLCLAVSGNILY